MDTNKIIAIGLVGVGAYLLAQQSGIFSTEPTYNVPGFGTVPESQLSQLGYINFRGLWISEQILQSLHQQQGSPGGSGVTGWLTWLANNGEAAYSTITNLVDEFGNLFGNNNYEFEDGFILGDPGGTDPFDIG